MEKIMGIQNYRQRVEKIRTLNLTSDLFSSVVFEDPGAAQDVLRILTGIRELKVVRAEPQKGYRNLYGHSSVLDVWAEDDAGTQYNLEIQIAEDEDHLRRSRFIQSQIDSRGFPAGAAYARLPELYLIFITAKDFLGAGKSVTEIVRMEKGTARQIENGVHEIYANLEYPDGDDERTRLLRYIRDTKNPDIPTDGFENLARRVRYLKEDEKGVAAMCEFSEWLHETGREEGLQEGRIQGERMKLIRLVLKKQARGMETEEIADLLEEDISVVEKIFQAITRAEEKTPESVYECMSVCCNLTGSA